MALVVGGLSLMTSPAPATAGPATWTLDGGPASLGFGEVDAISCPTTTYCVALDSNQYESDALVWTAGTWTAVPLAEPGGSLQLNSVACASDTFCMAVGESQVGRNASGVIESWNGATWSIVANPQSSGLDVWLGSVSCPDATSCYAVGQDSLGGLVDEWGGTSWTLALQQQGVSLSALSCSTSTNCAAVGAGASNALYSLVLAGGTWTAESVPDPGSDDLLYSVSCSAPTFCMAVGSAAVGGVGWATGLTEVWDGLSWQVVPSPNYPQNDLGPGFLGGGILITDSCVSAQDCVAVGYGGGGENASGLGYPLLAVVETWDGVDWSLTPTPAPIEPVGAAARATLSGVSCVPNQADAQCIAVGTQTPDNANFSALVETTPAAVGSLAATSTQLQSDGTGEYTATVSTVAPTTATASRTAAPAAAAAATSEPGPTGSVTFLNDGVPIASCPPQSLGSSGLARCSLGAGATGSITADYSGDSDFDGSSTQHVGTLPVTYSGNGSTGGAVPVDASSPYSSYSTVTVLGAGSLARTGYYFAGWNTSPSGSGTTYARGSTFTILASTSLYAVWKPKFSQTITFAPLPTMTLAQSPVKVSAKSSSGLPVSFVTTTPTVCTSGGTAGATITLLRAGTCAVQARQAGGLFYKAAPDVTRRFTVKV